MELLLYLQTVQEASDQRSCVAEFILAQLFPIQIQPPFSLFWGITWADSSSWLCFSYPPIELINIYSTNFPT